jgi:Flp pilus assembly protein CpaB
MFVRRILLMLLALASAGLAAYVLIEAVLTDNLSQQVFFAVFPLVLLLFSVAWNALGRKRD